MQCCCWPDSVVKFLLVTKHFQYPTLYNFLMICHPSLDLNPSLHLNPSVFVLSSILFFLVFIGLCGLNIKFLID